MTNEYEEIEKIVEQAVQLQRRGEGEKGLELLEETEKALWKLLDASENPKELEIICQKLARIVSAKGEEGRAALLYQMAKVWKVLLRFPTAFS